jgi:hypothetical protein
MEGNFQALRSLYLEHLPEFPTLRPSLKDLHEFPIWKFYLECLHGVCLESLC